MTSTPLESARDPLSVLVTGGSGYIGSHISRLLAERGDHVVVADDFVTGLPHRIAGFDQLAVDLHAPGAVDALEAIMRKHEVSAVVHLAARKQVPESVAQPLRYLRENMAGLAAVLEASTRAGVSRFVFSSSAAVYGDARGVVDEGAPCEPVNPYGQSKLAGEWLTADVASQTPLRAMSLRYFNVAGAGWPDLADTAVLNLVPMVIDRLESGESPVIFGDDYATPDGTCVRDFIHVLDLARAHLAGLDHLATQSAPHVVYNVGTGSGSSVREVVDGIRRRWPDSPSPRIVARREGDPATVVADPTSIQSHLGWRAECTLDDILDSVFAVRALR